jgi:hypothetical protein
VLIPYSNDDQWDISAKRIVAFKSRTDVWGEYLNIKNQVY